MLVLEQITAAQARTDAFFCRYPGYRHQHRQLSFPPTPHDLFCFLSAHLRHAVQLSGQFATTN
jgi:hypothetical protein